VTEHDGQDAHSTEPAAPPQKSSRLPGNPLWWAIGGSVALGAIAVTVILVFAGGGKDLRVNFALIDFDGGTTCAGGTGGYGDVGPGMDVVVRDNDGSVIGSSSLSGGEEIPYPDEPGLTAGCEWTAVVEDLPGHDYYSVSVGRRGEQVYSGEDLEGQNWEINLSLGP
jgi:hypothetical protein